MAQVIALAVADLHLRHSCPPARSAEPDWYRAMKRSLGELCDLQCKYDCPVLVAGDVFDRWNSPPELINFAIENLPDQMVAIPGQHDLPYHDLGSIGRSAYDTLWLADKIVGKSISSWKILSKFEVHRFPYGVEVRSKACSDLDIALIHSMIWVGHHGFAGVSEEANVKAWKSRLDGFDVAVFGDNHSGFVSQLGDCLIWNCGCLIRQKSNERVYRPMVGLIREDGSVEPYYLDISEDKWVDETDVVETDVGVSSELAAFLAELNNTQSDSLDFREAILEYLSIQKVSSGPKQVLMEAMEEVSV